MTYAFTLAEKRGLLADRQTVLPTGSNAVSVDSLANTFWIDRTPIVSLYFRDAAGLFWEREYLGDLRELDGDDFNDVHSVELRR